MKIQVYAVLRDHFDKEFELNESVDSVTALREVLIARNPLAKDILAICRFAVNNNFVENNFKLASNDNIHIIPPSSGG